MNHTRSLAFILITIALISFIISSCKNEGMFHEHHFSDATCTAPKTCECGETEGETLAHTFVDGMCACGESDPEHASPHIHSYKILVYDPTCTADGVIVYTCECGNAYNEIISATGHSHKPTVTEPTCTEEGYTTYTCACGDSYVSDRVQPIAHTYTSVVTPPTCLEVGYTTYTCACGDSYTADEVAVVDHVDIDVDTVCDFEGCHEIVIPAPDTTISIAVANKLAAFSVTANYYVEGIVSEIVNAKIGIFVISDGADNTLLVRLPKNESGAAYSSWAEGKVTLGDTIRIYGKPTQNTETPTEQATKIGGGVLTVLSHEHSFLAADCLRDESCGCGVVNASALGHIDEAEGVADGICDRCGHSVTLTSEYINIATNTNGILNDEKTKWTWSGDAFEVEITNGASLTELYTASNDFMLLNSQNKVTVYNVTGAIIQDVVIYTTNLTRLTNLVNAMANQNIIFTRDDLRLCVVVSFGADTDFSFVNSGIVTVCISGIDVVYVPSETIVE